MNTVDYIKRHTKQILKGIETEQLIKWHDSDDYWDFLRECAVYDIAELELPERFTQVTIYIYNKEIEHRIERFYRRLQNEV